PIAARHGVSHARTLDAIHGPRRSVRAGARRVAPGRRRWHAVRLVARRASLSRPGNAAARVLPQSRRVRPAGAATQAGRSGSHGSPDTRIAAREPIRGVRDRRRARPRRHGHRLSCPPADLKLTDDMASLESRSFSMQEFWKVMRSTRGDSKARDKKPLKA